MGYKNGDFPQISIANRYSNCRGQQPTAAETLRIAPQLTASTGKASADFMPSRQNTYGTHMKNNPCCANDSAQFLA